VRDCTTGRTAKRMKPSLRSRGAESGSTPRASQSGAPWTVPPRFAMGTWPHRRRSHLQQSISTAPANARQGRCSSVPHVRHEQSVAIGIQRDHLSVLSPTRKGPSSCPAKKLPTRAAARQPPRSPAKGSASICSGRFGIRRSQRNRSARRRPPTSRRNRPNAQRDLDRSEDRGGQRYCRIFPTFESAS
jgi:hypothetical protein